MSSVCPGNNHDVQAFLLGLYISCKRVVAMDACPVTVFIKHNVCAIFK